MYELNRVRLFCIGPRGARYTDVTLDLSGVGQIIAGQGSLFGTTVRRPSPYSLLLLENGGGKSVLLKLLFSVVLPGRRNAVGGSAAVMEKFVLGDDAAHIVLEWMHVRTGDRVITGKALQRRRSGPAADRLAEHWWSLRPHHGVEIETLPFTADGRRLRLEGFREALQEIDRAAPITQLTWVGAEVGAWADHLRDTGIEPDLFGIQRRMNADEGDAASAFKFKSSREFVEWLLKIVLDAEDAVSVAGNFDSYARTVGDRHAMLLERDFADGAVAALRPVADAHERHRAARANRESAVRDGTALLLRVRAREAAEAEATQRLRQLATDAAATATAREGDRDRARDIVNETRRQTYVLERADAQREHDHAKAGRDAADADLRGWALAELIERKTAAQQKSVRLAAQITQAERDARPALDERDRAAGALLRKLHAEAAAAREERDRRNKLAAAHRGNAAELDKEGRQALVEVERQRAEQKAIVKEVADSRAKVEAAVTAGLLAAGQGVAEAASEATEAARVAAERIRQAEQSLDGVRRAVSETAKAVGKTREALSVARGRHRDANRDLQAVLDQAARLTANELVQVALSTDVVDVDMLDGSADTVAERLHDDDVERERRLDELRDAQREDQRLLEALGDGGLLPPRMEVEASLKALRAVGVGAHAGWQYLAENVAAAERSLVIEAHPQLADGVVIVDPAAMPAARQALNAARLLPAAAVAVGTGARMLAATTERPGFEPIAAVGEQFVVEPNPALFDAEAAEIKRGQLRETMEGRGSEIHTAAATLKSLREVQTELAAWRRSCPAGRLSELRETLDTRARELADAAEADGIAVAAAEAAATLCEQIEDELRDLRPVERAAADRAGELDRLAKAVAATEEQRRRLPEIDDAITSGERTANELTNRRDRAQEQATDAALAAESANARAERHRAEMGEVVISTGEHAATVPSENIPLLRSAYQAASAAYAAVEVGHDLRSAADTADTEAARLRADVDGNDPDDIARGAELLRSPDGADVAGRQAAIARTKRERTRCDEAIGTAKEKAGVITGQLETATPSDNRNVWIQLPEERRPTSVEHGRQLLTAAIADQRVSQQRHEESFAEATRLQQRAGDAGEATRAFGAVGEPLAARLDQTDTLLETGSVESYAGTSEQARTAAAGAQERLRDTGAAERSTHQEVIRLVDVAVRLASESKFEAMTNVARRALVGLDREQLAARAGEFATQLEQRLATLTSDLDSAGRHRKLIVDRLAALVDSALKTLRTASRLSKLPAGLGEWEGKEFLRIRFAEPDPSLLTARVGEVVDELSATVTGRPGSAAAPKRDGLALLLRSIEAAVPKGFLVDILKPDAVLRDERVPIENMNEVFSGGQELTAAIVLYCTMAALRANERGQIRARHSGVLFLDNPIGKASAEYLLELQQGVAAALGVQLVYTTGLSDDRALSAFPLWVRMRNDADLRAGLKHIRVAEVVRRQLPEPFPDDDPSPNGTALGTVTATRVYRRPV